MFIFATYWVCTVVTTVGYGDYTGGTTLEYIYSFAIEFFGILIFAIIQISVLDLISIKHSFETYAQERDFEALVWFKRLEQATKP